MSGFLDGIALAAATGREGDGLIGGLSGFTPVVDRRVLLVAARDLDPAERELLEGSAIGRVAAENLRRAGAVAALAGPLEALDAREAHVHVDLDALDPDQARANEFAPRGGLSLEELEGAIRVVRERLTVRSAALASYDPQADSSGAACRAALRILEALVAPLAEAHA